jgi:hypothetical protein
MKNFHVALTIGLLITVVSAIAHGRSSQDTSKSVQATANASGVHDFDFIIGEWRVRHHYLRASTHEWLETDGTCSNRKLMDGSANLEEHLLNAPSGAYRAIALRTYDPKTEQWAIWWLDGRDPIGPLDPPLKGRFENGVGTFYANDTVNGKPIRKRFIWLNITTTSARWEQAYSSDAGKTWETNWIMEFQRVS